MWLLISASFAIRKKTEKTKTKILTTINRKLVNKIQPSNRMKTLFFIYTRQLQVKKAR